MQLTNEDILTAVIGGVLVGLASTLNYALYGRLTNLSGIFNSLVKFKKNMGMIWKLSFFIGLITGPQYFYWMYGRKIELNGKTYTFLDSD